MICSSSGLRENDKILRINKRTPRDVNDAVGIIKKAGKEMLLTVGRRDQPDVVNQGTYSAKKKDKDRREGKGRRVC